MKFSNFAVSLAVFMFSFVTIGKADAADKGDVYFGYSRVGANLYAANTSGMNGWHAAAQVKIIPFLGVEGDVSRYSQSGSGFSQQATLVMFGPRATVHAAGFSVFAHGLAGIVHENATLTFFSSVGYNATSYALGGGADVPLLLRLKLRVTGDYLGNSNAPTAAATAGGRSPSHYRIGVGAAYHF